MMKDKKQAYLFGIESIHQLQIALLKLNEIYTANYDKLSWEERRPDIIKKLIEADRNVLNAKYLLLECVMEEENVLNESLRKNYGKTSSK